MHTFSQGPVKYVAWLGIGMTVIVLFRIGGSFAHIIGQFAPLLGAFIGSGLTLFSACYPLSKKEKAERQVEPWIGWEQLSWLLIGMGILMWGLGESFWRYFVSVNQTSFPSLADAGYTIFPLLAFCGLLLQPSPDTKSRRLVLVLDSLISMGSIFAIAWYLLLGSLAQAQGEANLAKFLGIYYPASDVALLSCVIFLLLRGQGRVCQTMARRAGLALIGLGFAFFVTSDFLFNIQQNANTYVEATWIDLGWPLGMMTIGIAAYMRRFLPAISEEVIRQRVEDHVERANFSAPQVMPYGLLGLLFLTLSLDVLAPDLGQRAIRPVLLFATLGVVALVVTRQFLTLWDNIRLSQRQAQALEELGKAHQHIEEQARQLAAYNTELEQGIEHLKTVQAGLANGNLRARAHLNSGPLLPLAGSLNLMAERLMRMGQGTAYAQRLLNALGDLCLALERTAFGTPLIIPESCNELTEINRLLVALRIKRTTNPQSNFESRQQVQSFTPMAPMTSKTPPGPLPPVLPALHSDMHAIKPTPRTPTPVQNHHPITQPLTLGSSGSPTSNADGTARYKGQRPAHNILGVRPSPTPPNTNPYRQEHRGD